MSRPTTHTGVASISGSFSSVSGAHCFPSNPDHGQTSRSASSRDRQPNIRPRHPSSSSPYELSPAHWHVRQEQRDSGPAQSISRPTSSLSERLPGVKEIEQFIPHPKKSRSESDAPNTQLPLSVYESRMATYMWPRFDPASHAPPADGPVIYVKYKPSTPTPSNLSSPSPSNVEKRRDSPRTDESEVRPTYNNSLYARKRSSSVETETPPGSPSDRFLKHRRISRELTSSHGDGVNGALGSIPPSSYDSSQQRAERDLPANFRRLDIESEQSDEETSHSFERYLSPRITSVAQGYSQKDSLPPQKPLENISRTSIGNVEIDLSNSEEWLKYARGPEVSNSVSQYTCSWPVHDNHGRTTSCGYSSKRHLVKRHIESKHLQLRPCICHICGKGFAQKSNLETHLNTHTGDAPHKCPYPNCGEFFKDPARRHRHMKAVHQHISSRTKKNMRQPNESSPDGSDAEEEPIANIAH